MNDARLSERSIFEAAFEKGSPEERAAYLDEACGSNEGLRQEVEVLLAAHDRLRSIHPAAVVPGLGATVDESAVTERPGTIIGPYTLRELIGEGGMGLVYVAEQQQPVRRKVALKIIKPGMDSRQVVARFEAERQALALMDHPNIARVFDAGTTDSGRPYFVMELVKGVSLTEYCDQNRLTTRQRLELFIPICQAVQHAHHKGIIHRDLKPANILVTVHDVTPVVKVIDFGVAKAIGQQLTEKTVYTSLVQLVGTAQYMSPEQAGLSGLDADTRSDIYALGVLLYELLTGTTPFESETLRKAGYDEMRRIIREDEPPKPSTRLSTLERGALSTVSERRSVDPRKLRHEVRGEMDWIVMKALEKDRNRRYETANAFAADVQCYLNDKPVEACPPSLSYRLRKFARRNKVALATTGLVAVALLFGTAVSIWQAVEATDARQLADERLVSEKQAHSDADKAADRERKMADETREKQRYTATLLAGHQLDEGLKRLNEGNSEGLLDLLDARETADDLPDLRDTVARLWAISHNEWEGRLTHVLPYGRNVTFSPDGRVLAIVGPSTLQGSPTDAVHLIDTVTGQSRLSPLQVPKETGGIVFSPDGRLLGTHSVKLGGRLWDTATGQPIGKPLAHNSIEGIRAEVIGTTVAFSPDGKLLATGGWDGTVRVWDVVSGRPRAEPIRDGSPVIGVAFSPDGKWLASGNTNGTVRVSGLAGGRSQVLKHPWAEANWVVYRILFTPDSRRIITLCGGVMVWQTETGRLVKTLRRGWFIAAALSADGKILAAGEVNGKVHFWDIETGQAVGQPLVHGERSLSVLFSPDRQRLAVVSLSGTTIYEIGGRSRGSLVFVGSDGGPCAWSPDGRFLATSGQVKLWRVEERALRTIPVQFSNLVALSPDGKELAQWIPGANTVLLQNAATGEQLERLEVGGERKVNCLAFSPDGKLLAIGDAGWGVQIWGKDGKQARRIRTLDQPRGLAWSPDASRIMVATPMNGLVTEFDQATAKAIDPPFKHADWVRAVCYSPDGNMIATVGGDESVSVVRLWSTRLRPMHPPLVLSAKLPGGNVEVEDSVSVAFSQDGQLLWVQPPRGDAILFRLPSPPPDLHEIRLRTWLALGARRDANGVTQPIPAEEWSRLRQELLALDRKREPIRWEALESSFADELLSRAQKIASHRLLTPPIDELTKQTAPRGFVQTWLVLSELVPYEGTDGARALGQQQVPGEALLRPRAGDRVEVSGKTLLWKEHQSAEPYIDFPALYRSPSEYRVTYAICYVYASTERTDLALRVGSEDQALLYLNGEDVYRQTKNRALKLDEDEIRPITLRKGINVLVFKVVNQGGPGPYGCLRLVTKDGAPPDGIEYRLAP